MKKRESTTPYKYSLFHNVHYSYCRKYINKEDKVDREVFKKLTKYIVDSIFDLIFEEPDGIYIEGFGYFYIFMEPDVRVYYTKRFTNPLGRRYYPMFVADGKINPLRNYYLPYSLADFRRKIHHRVKDGQLYKSELTKVLTFEEVNWLNLRAKE